MVEILVTSALVEAWQRALPEGCVLRRVPKEEQFRGDLCLEGVGRTPLYIELKTEAYPASLFLEPIQFWQRATGDITYSRSWGFTTSAQLMLYLSGRTGQLLLCPREHWLSTGMKLFQGYLLGTRNDGAQAFRPYVTVNSKADFRGVRHYSGGAAGAAMETTSWLRAYQALGHDVGLLQMADGAELVAAAKQQALSLSEDDIRETLRTLKRKADDATVSGVRDELRAWAEGAEADEAANERRALQELLSVYHEVKGIPAADLAAASTLVSYLAQPALTQLSNQPLHDDMWFLAATCLQCPWTKHYGADTDRILAQAMGTPMRLDPKGLPAGTSVPPKMQELSMRFGADVARHGARPSWDTVRAYVLETDPQQLRAWQGEYFRANQHPARRATRPEAVPA